MILPNGNRSDNTARYQCDLFDYGRNAQETQRESYLATIGTRSKRVAEVLNLVANAGDNGLTRNEIAEALKVPTSSCTSAIQKLLKDHVLVETDQRRQSSFGRDNAVVVLRV